MADEKDESGFDLTLHLKERVSWQRVYRWAVYTWRTLMLIILSLLANGYHHLGSENDMLHGLLDTLRQTVTTNEAARLQADRLRDVKLDKCEKATDRYIKFLDDEAKEAQRVQDYARKRRFERERAEIEKIINPQSQVLPYANGSPKSSKEN